MIRVGTINDGGLPILADISGGLGEAVRLHLQAHYAPETPPGFPARPSFVGSAAPHHPRIIPAGTEITVLAPEAKALIEAGVAVHAPVQKIDWRTADLNEFFIRVHPANDGAR